LRERTVVEKLSGKLRDRNQHFSKDDDQHLGDVYTRVNPARSRGVNSLLLKKGDDIRAIEVKLFKLRSNNSLSRSYYEGIDQAIALLMYGFNRAALWHVFDQDIEMSKVSTYGSIAQVFIVDKLKLPIDYTAWCLDRSGPDYEFIPTKPILGDFRSMDVKLTIPLVKIQDPRLRFVWVRGNPLLEDGRVRNIREALMQWLDKRKQS
jgi:hypothetical protein